MAVEQGMNRPVVIEVAHQLQQHSHQLVDIQNNADRAVSELTGNWLGHDSDQYAHDWAQASKQLTLAADIIQVMSKMASLQAQEQERTSQA